MLFVASGMEELLQGSPNFREVVEIGDHSGDLRSLPG